MGAPCESPSGLPVILYRFANLRGSLIPFEAGDERKTARRREAVQARPEQARSTTAEILGEVNVVLKDPETRVWIAKGPELR